jgi:uncharacterized protein (TIGR02466 family)
MRIEPVFPTLIARGSLNNASTLNQTLRKEIKSFSSRDRMGKEWSKENYRGGYTSYASLNDLHRRAPVFMEFAETMQPNVDAFGRAQGWELRGLRLEMTDCWMNIMTKNVHHSLHLHPHSVISGTYYVSTPRGSVALKLEDPRMSFYMNAPTRSRRVRKDNPLYYEVAPISGSFVLFESWVRHEVPPNQSQLPRISLSFNYSLVNPDL